MTLAQRRWIERIGAEGAVPADEIPRVTLRALYGHGMLEDCPRMFYGPRMHRVRLSKRGNAERERQKLPALAGLEREAAMPLAGEGEKP